MIKGKFGYQIRWEDDEAALPGASSSSYNIGTHHSFRNRIKGNSVDLLQSELVDNPGRSRSYVLCIGQVRKPDKIAKLTNVVEIMAYYQDLAGVNTGNGRVAVYKKQENQQLRLERK